MCRADGTGLDPPGLSLALCSMAPGVSLQELKTERKTHVEALPLQTGNTHNKTRNCWVLLSGTFDTKKRGLVW